MDRRLTRSRDALVGGVASGVARWLNADPALVRIVWAVLVPLTSGMALVAYIVAWIVMPEEGPGPKAPATGEGPGADGTAGTPLVTTDAPRREDRTAYVIGGGLVLLGLWFLVREYLPELRWDLVWPIVLVVAGAAVLLTASRRR